jgi:hypothetical protein
MDTGAQLEFVAERLRGEIARFDITDKDGKVVVEKDKRITARHVRTIEQSETTFISVPEDYLIGRMLARNVVDADTGEILAKANDELTDSLLKKLRVAGVKEIPALYTNELDEGRLHLADAGCRRDRRPAGRARRDLPDDAPRRAADRRRRRGAVPSAVLQRRHVRPVARRPDEVQRPRRPRYAGRRDDACRTRTSSTSSRSWSSCATAAARSTTSTTSATGACAASASWRRTSTAPASRASRRRSRNGSARPRPRR